MTDMQFTDRAPIGAVTRNEAGYLIADAFAVRTGIQKYAGFEVGLVDREIINVYRPEEEVKSVDSLKTFTHAPVTLGHPDVMVDSENWKEFARGELSTEAQWIDGKIKLPLIVKDAEAIAAIDNGVRELSAGYTCNLEFVDGVTPEGEKYDAIQRNIRVNHIAIVPNGRAGSECRIGDAVNWGTRPVNDADRKENPMTDKLRTIMVDGLSVETTDAGAQAIEKLTKDMAKLQKAMSDAATEHKAALDSKDEEIGTFKADLKKANDGKLDQAAIDKLVADRAELLGTVKAIDADIKVDGLSDADLKRAAVAKVLGDDAVKEVSDAEVSGMFKVVAKDAAKADPVAKALIDGNMTKVVDLDEIYKQRNQALEDAWKTPVKEA